MPPVSETICEQLKMCELTSLILDIQDLTCRHQEHYLIGVKPEQGGPNWEEFFCRIFDLELTQDGSEVEDGKQFFHDSMIRVLKRMKVIDDEMLERLNPFLHKALGAIIDPSLKKNHWELIFELLHARLRSVRDPQHTLNENDIRLCLTSPNYVINAFFALKNKNNWDTISKVCSEYMSFWQKNKCIHTLMIEGPHISFVLLYYFLPEEDFKQLVMIKEGGCNILHFMQEFICDAAALRINYTEVVGPLIAKHFVQLLSDTNDDANNPLHICALRGTTILLEYCLKLVKEGSISKTDLLPVLTARNHEGQTPLEGCGEAPSRTRQLFEQLLLLCGAEEGNKDPEEAISIYSFDDNPPPPPGGNGAESRSIKADWLFQSAFL